MMAIRGFVLFLIALSLMGATPARAVPRDYAIVDDVRTPLSGWYETIEAAVSSGATTIEVREGNYPENVVLDRSLTLLCREGATLINDGASVSIRVTAAHVTVKGCAIEGSHAGGDIGGYGDGTGVYVTAPNVHLDGLITRNLKSFSVLAVGTSFLTLENYHFSNVATSPDVPLYAQYAIHLNSTDNGIIRNGFVTGSSQAVGTWYSADRNRIYGNVFLDNWGYVGSGGNYVPRSVYENYGVPVGAENYGNWFYDNEIDGGRGAIELADSLIDTVVRNNTIRNTDNCFAALGSGSNHSINLVIEGNHCYGDGVNCACSNHLTGENIRVVDNWFYDYVDNATGTIWTWGADAKGIVIEGNTFIGNGTAARFSEGDTVFRNNTITENIAPASYLTIDNSATSVTIDGNAFGGTAARIDANNATNLTITDNRIYGYLWLWNVTSNSVIRGNDIHNPAVSGYGLYAPTESIVRDNRIRADIPVHMQGGATDYLLLADNFLTDRNGGTVTLPVCSGTNTCTRNWSAGQTPPP